MTRHEHDETRDPTLPPQSTSQPQPAPGRPLDPPVRSRMEDRLGHDFSSVRIHESAEQASELHARAFAVGEDVTFAPGQYAPGTTQGDQLLAHELGHVADQHAGAPAGAYRAPEGEPVPETTTSEQPLRLPKPRSLFPDLGLGSLTLGLATVDGFATNKDEVPDPDRVAEVARDALSMLTKMPGGTINVTGHTDRVGAEQNNLDLGRRRAATVAVLLIKAGVPATSIVTSSAGETQPAVETEAAEPRNRRVEIRYAAPPIGSEPEGPQLSLDPARKQPGFVPPPGGFLGPRSGPIFSGPPFPGYQPPKVPDPQQGTQPGQGPNLDPGSPEPTTKPGSPGDIAKAVAATSTGKRILEGLKNQAEHDLRKLGTGDKVILGTVAGSIAAGVIAGIASDPAARKGALDFIDGKEIPIPGLDGVAVVPHTKDGGIGGGVSFDLVKIFGGGK